MKADRARDVDEHPLPLRRSPLPSVPTRLTCLSSVKEVGQLVPLRGGNRQSCPVVVQGVAGVLPPHLQDRGEGPWGCLRGSRLPLLM